MNLLQFPDVVAMYQGGKTAGLERDEVNALVSMLYSSWLSFLWRSGSARWALWAGEGKAMQDAATAAFLSLESLQKKGFLSLSVPSDMLEASNLSKFITETKTK